MNANEVKQKVSHLLDMADILLKYQDTPGAIDRLHIVEWLEQVAEPLREHFGIYGPRIK